MKKLVTLILLLVTVQAQAFGLWDNAGFGFGGNSSAPSSITDLFNGLNRAFLAKAELERLSVRYP